MGSLIELRSDSVLWSIKDIPPYRMEKDAEKLRARCESIFRIKGDRHVIVVTGRGEILSGFESVDQLIDFYTKKRLISLIRFTPEEVKLLTHISV
jgi:hypothetical protein